MENKFLVLGTISGLFLAVFSYAGSVQAASCCTGAGDCTIIQSPCTIGGSFTNRNIDINVDTANPIRINLTGDLDLTGSDIDFENKFAGANKQVIVNGQAPVNSAADGKNIDMSGGDIVYPSGGLTIDLSVPDSSTGNGGNLSITGAGGTSVFPGSGNLKIYTSGSNAAGGSPTKGGDVDVTFTSDTLLSAASLIKTGNTSVAKVDGGLVDLTGTGDIGIESSSNFISTSSSRKAGDVDITGTGYFKGGIHANSCEGFAGCGQTGGTIDMTGLEKYYSVDCNSLEAKEGGLIDFTGSGFFDLPASAATGAGGTLHITGSTLSDCSCLSGGGSCWTSLNANNETVDFTGVDCDESDPKAACPSAAVTPNVTTVNSTNPDGFYKAGAVIDITVKFSSAVVVTGGPTLELETGAVDRKAVFSAGSGSDTLVFKYTVQTGDDSNDLDYKAANSLSPNGGTIKDPSGTNNANLNLPAPGAANSLGANRDIIIDTQKPNVAVAAYDKDGTLIADGASISASAAATVKFETTAWDNKGVYANTISWTTNDWTDTNQVNCGSSASCYVRIDSTPISFSTNDSTWQDCDSNPACTITNPIGPLSDGAVIKYKGLALDSALNSTNAEYDFSVNAVNLSVTTRGYDKDSVAIASGGSIDIGQAPAQLESHANLIGANLTQQIMYYTTDGTDPVVSPTRIVVNCVITNPTDNYCVASIAAAPAIVSSYSVIDSDAGGDTSANYSFSITAAAGAPPVITGCVMSIDDLCELGPNPTANFGWGYSDPDGDPQKYYQVQIADNNAFTPIMYDSLKQPGAQNQIETPVLGYGKTYWYRINVWDTTDTKSVPDWQQTCQFNTLDSVSHQYPTAKFKYCNDDDWNAGASKCMNISSVLQFQSAHFDPKDSEAYGGSSITSWAWDFDYAAGGAGEPSLDDLTKFPVHIYTQRGDHKVNLRVTDSSGYACWASDNVPPGTETISVGMNNPKWDETTP